MKHDTMTISSPVLLALACILAVGCEGKNDAAPATESAAEVVAPLPPDLDALPTLEEVEEEAAEVISDENADEALRELEAELDSEADGG